MSRDLKYHERARVQCLSWAKGEPYHERVNDECCPDFSCCYPALFTADAAARWAEYHRQYGRQN